VFPHDKLWGYKNIMSETQEVPQTKKNNNGGTKALALMSAVAATALGVFAGFSQYVTPLRQDFIVLQKQTERNFTRMESELRDKLTPLQKHLTDEGHPGVTSKLDILNEEINKINNDIIRHEALVGHPGLVSKMAAIIEQLKEIETQFRWGTDVRDREIGHILARLDKLEEESKQMLMHVARDRLKDKKNDALISLLWEKVFKEKKIPNTP